MPWIKVGLGKETYFTEEQLECMRKEADAVLGKTFALHGCERFDERDKYALYLQTGKKIEDSAQLRAYMKDKDVRPMERGDKASQELEQARNDAGSDYGKEMAEAKVKGKVPFAS